MDIIIAAATTAPRVPLGRRIPHSGLPMSVADAVRSRRIFSFLFAVEAGELLGTTLDRFDAARHLAVIFLGVLTSCGLDELSKLGAALRRWEEDRLIFRDELQRTIAAEKNRRVQVAEGDEAMTRR